MWIERRLRRRAIVGGAIVGGAVAWAGLVAAAPPPLSITPPAGPPGTEYTVEVSCGAVPVVKRANTQDAPVQGTIAPYPEGSMVEVAPSTWQIQATGGRTDDDWYATCSGDEVSAARFDAEAPHLWFGPRPRLVGSRLPLTALEGTDCPAGSTASGQIVRGDGEVVPFLADIDASGDWWVGLPAPVGSEEMTITASCGSVTYDRLVATTTTTTEASSAPTTAPTVPPTAPPATPWPAAPSYTG